MKKKILWTIDLILLALLVILVGALLIRDRKGKGADAPTGQESPGAYAAEGAAPDRPSTVSGLTAEPIPRPEPADGADGTPGGTESTQDAADDAQNAAGAETDPESGTDELQQDDFAADSGTGSTENLSEYTILYGGDVCVQNSIQVTYDAKGTPGIVGENLLAELTGADTTVLNHEFCFSERGEPAPDKQYTFRAHPGYVRLLQDMGADIVSLANNHALDYGKEALSDTFVTLDDAGIDYMGAGATEERAAEMITREAGDYTIGFMAASRVYPVVSWNVLNSQPGMLPAYDADYLAAKVKEKAPLCDYLIIYVHWGVERETYPEDYERTLGKMLIDAGADAVVGSHPHVLQGMEFYKNKPIFYSLGNFVFNASISRTAYLKATIDLEQAAAEGADELSDYVSWSITPCRAADYRTEIVSDEGNRAEFYRYMTSISYDVECREDGSIVNLRDN